MATLIKFHASTGPILSTRPSDSVVTSSHNARSEMNDHVKEMLWEEMANGGWVQDDRIMQHLLKSTPTPSSVLPKFEASLKKFKLEKELYQALRDLFVASIEDLDIQSTFHIMADIPPVHSIQCCSNLHPDMIMMPLKVLAGTLDMLKVLWLHVELFLEIKPSFSSTILHEAREQAATYARQVIILYTSVFISSLMNRFFEMIPPGGSFLALCGVILLLNYGTMTVQERWSWTCNSSGRK